jgi:hypothetical protein
MEWKGRLKAFIKYLSTYKDIPVFLRAVGLKFYDALFGASATGILMSVLIPLFHMSWFWLLMIFVGGFAAAAYGSWREEYAKSAYPSIRGAISAIGFAHLIRDRQQVYLTLVIRNNGVATALDRWTVEFQLKDFPRRILCHEELEQGQDGPNGETGGNLIHDSTILESGGRRPGWIAFILSNEEAQLLMKEKDKLEVRFYDMSDRQHQALCY